MLSDSGLLFWATLYSFPTNPTVGRATALPAHYFPAPMRAGIYTVVYTVVCEVILHYFFNYYLLMIEVWLFFYFSILCSV